jgi:RimJ/RimL family protein N-acetyltransferase
MQAASSPVGDIVENWTGRPAPERVTLTGRTVRLEPLEVERHGEVLWEAAQAANEVPGFWDYLGYGPYLDRAIFDRDMTANAASSDPLFFAAIDLRTGRAEGVLSLMRIDAANGVAEVGHIWFGPTLQRTTAATEAIYLAADYVLTTLGYRRFEWKCNSLNAPSRRAAERFGFTYEGTFRKHSVVKGRNRDTAWYAMTDNEWPAIRDGFVTWLDPVNFDGDGNQIRSLEACRLAR